MAAILTSTIDSAPAVSRYFLPYQLDWIRDEARMKDWEKSFRIGATFCDGFANVRKRLRFSKRDYLFATKDWPSALEYMGICKQFCDVFGVAKSIVSATEELTKVPMFDAERRDTGFTEEIKIGKITFDNGSRIIAFTSNPNAMLVYGGDVGLDEFPRHGRAQELYDIAQARVTWGYDLAMWGSHRGTDTLFYQMVLQARKGEGGWSHHFTTIEDAVRQGLVEKINETRGTNFTREGFIADCRKRARTEETYQEAYMCNPKGGTAAIVPWSQIELCQIEQPGERVHLEAKQINELFGEYRRELQRPRAVKIEQYLRGAFAQLFSASGRHTFGYDVAASGEGDLAAIYVDRIESGMARCVGLMTWRTDDWDFHEVVTFCFMRSIAGLSAAGDETGLGRQICWTLAKHFVGQFVPVNFASSKHDMGFALMNQLATAEKRWPKAWQDLSSDYFALRKTFDGGKWRFTAGTNPSNESSHCDMAWAGALATEAKKGGGPVVIESVHRAGRDRGGWGGLC